MSFYEGLTEEQAREVPLSPNPFKRNQQIEQYLGEMGVTLIRDLNMHDMLFGGHGIDKPLRQPDFVFRRRHLVRAASAAQDQADAILGDILHGDWNDGNTEWSEFNPLALAAWEKGLDSEEARAYYGEEIVELLKQQRVSS